MIEILANEKAVFMVTRPFAGFLQFLSRLTSPKGGFTLSFTPEEQD